MLHDALALLFGSGVCEDGQKGIQHVLCPRETQLSRIQVEGCGCRVHSSACQITGCHSEHEFFGHHGCGLSVERMQANLAFQGAQIGFNVPSVPIEFQNLLQRQS